MQFDRRSIQIQHSARHFKAGKLRFLRSSEVLFEVFTEERPQISPFRGGKVLSHVWGSAPSTLPA